MIEKNTGQVKRIVNGVVKHRVDLADSKVKVCIIGRDFGVVTDIKTGRWHFFVISLDQGTIYENFGAALVSTWQHRNQH